MTPPATRGTMIAPLAGGLLVVAACCCLARADGLAALRMPQQWPEVYSARARAEVTAPLAAQAQNGLVLDLTVWNYHFLEGSDKLRKSGQLLLDRLARREGDTVVGLYLQTARDVKFDAEHPEQFLGKRSDLNARRLKAISVYLTS